MRHASEYPFNEGRVVSSQGLDIDAKDYERHFTENNVEHSTALHSALNGSLPYLVGPLARYSLNFDHLSALAQQTAREAGLEKSCRNPFRSIAVRAIEILYACDEALRIVEDYEEPDRPAAECEVRAGTGWACTEAPRGLLYHRYRIDGNGAIQEAKIVPPTSQNQRMIELDLRDLAPQYLDLPDEQLRARCEHAVRNYDPCNSCSTHFLKLTTKRR